MTKVGLSHNSYVELTLILGFTLFVILLLVVFSYVEFRKKQKQKFLELVQEYETQLLGFNKISAELERLKNNEKDIIAEKEQEVRKLQAQLAQSREKLLQNKLNDKLLEFKESSIVSLFREKSTGKLHTTLPKETEWRQLTTLFSRNLPVAYATIGRSHVLSPQELRVCVLLILGFTTSEIGILLDVKPQHVTVLKKRINMKLFGENSAYSLNQGLSAIFSME